MNRIDRPTWQQRLRTRIVSRGIQMMCDKATVSAAAATDISLLSGAKFDRVSRQLGNVDDFGACQLLLKLGDAALVLFLHLFCCVVFGVLRKVTIVCPRLGELPDDPWPLKLQSMPKLVFELRMALCSHWDFLHWLKLAGLTLGAEKRAAFIKSAPACSLRQSYNLTGE